MILIDSLYINMGGGKVLLDYLCSRMIERGMEFTLLKDERCGVLHCDNNMKNVIMMKAGLKERKFFYKKHREEFSAVLCFGNVPPPIKMPCRVHTYFHNINLLSIPSEFPLMRKMRNWLKQRYITSLAKNTDTWIVQTKNTEACLRKVLPCNNKQVLQLPFYYIPEELKAQANNITGRKDYILVGNYTGTRGHDELLGAFYLLKDKGITPTLHLTVSDDNSFSKEIDHAISEGVQIQNHGIVPYSELVEIYGQCKATIYPSINESLGLGIIEAIEAGCDVIASDLPFTHSICRPSEMLAQRTLKDIANAVIRYERGVSPKSQLLIHDCVEELIDMLKSEK